MVYLMGGLYLLAGTMHFVAADIYLQMMPPQLPWPLFLVWLSGLCEMALGALVMVPRTRRLAAWGLILLLLAVFPANVHMALQKVRLTGLPPWLTPPTPQALWIRLPFQAVLIAWAALYTRPTPSCYRSRSCSGGPG